MILDGAHVPFNLAAVLRDLRRIRELRGFCVVVFAAGRDKQALQMLELLKQNGVDVVICSSVSSGHRTWAPNELCRFAKKLELAAETIPRPRDALMKALALTAGRGWILVTGSIRSPVDHAGTRGTATITSRDGAQLKTHRRSGSGCRAKDFYREKLLRLGRNRKVTQTFTFSWPFCLFWLPNRTPFTHCFQAM